MATAPDNENLRRSQRLLLTPRGEVSDGTTSVKALLQDVSSGGMLLICSKVYTPGQTLTLKFQVSTGTIVECQVEVRHSSDMGTGVRIVTISEQHRRAYDRYLQEYYSSHLGKLG